jgi:hypothetical protein
LNFDDFVFGVGFGNDAGGDDAGDGYPSHLNFDDLEFDFGVKRPLDVAVAEAVVAVKAVVAARKRPLDVAVAEAVVAVMGPERPMVAPKRPLDVCVGQAAVAVVGQAAVAVVGQAVVAKRSECPVQCQKPARKQQKLE